MSNVYVFTDYDSLGEEQIKLFASSFPDAWQKQLHRYHNHMDQCNFMMGRTLLRYALYKDYGIRDILAISYHAQGKPYFPENPSIHFNISHCKKGVVCAISHAQIGIDIETIRPFHLKTAKHICNEEEFDFIVHSTSPDLAFSKLWSKKESLIKYTGKGLQTVLPSILKENTIPIEFYDYEGLIIHVCGEEPNSLFPLSITDLINIQLF